MSVKVFIKEACGKITEIELSDAKYASYTVLQLKRDLRDKKIFTDRSQLLFFKWCHLDNDAAKLSDYGIQHESTVHLLHNNHLIINLFLINHEGRTITFWLHEDELKSCRVEDLKIRIRDIEGVPEDQQRLIYESRELLDDSRTLSDYGIQHYSTIQLALKLRGGGTLVPKIGGGGMGDKEGKNRSMEHMFFF